MIDAGGSAVMPGLVDGHVHPVFGEWTPTQDTIGWIGNYVHGGTTTMVSACELHVPGLDYENLTPDLVTSLAVVTAAHHRPRPLERRAGACRHRHPRARHDGGAFRPARRGEVDLRQVHLLSARHPQGRGAALSAVVPRPRHPHQGAHRRRVALRPVADVRLRHPVVAAAGRRRAYQRRADPDERRGPRQGDRRHVVRGRNLLLGQLRLDQARGRPHAREGPARAAHARHRHAGRHRRRSRAACCATSATCRRSAAWRPARRSPSRPATPRRRTASTSASSRPAGPPTSSICGPVEGSAGTSIADAIAHGDLPGIAYVIADGEIVVSGRSRQTPPPKRKLFFSCCDAHGGTFAAS